MVTQRRFGVDTCHYFMGRWTPACIRTVVKWSLTTSKHQTSV